MANQIEYRVLGAAEPTEPWAEILTLAFENYAVPRAAFAMAPEPRIQWVDRVSQLALSARQSTGTPTVVATFDGRPVGVAALNVPDIENPPEIIEKWKRVFEGAGPGPDEFFAAFMAAVDSVEVPKRRVWISMLGVHPEFQGKGIGRGLIDEVAKLAREIEGCTGLGLDTETPSNVVLYERCGFKVVGESSVGDLPIYVMWRDL